MASKNPAVRAARQLTLASEDNIVTLCTGVRARLQGVASALVSEAQMQIPDPPVPVITRDDGSQDENPFDPEYQQALKDADNRRMLASVDATIMFGVILIDDIDDDDAWVSRLRWMEKRGKLDLSDYDLDDLLDREFLYKKYIAVTNKEVMQVMALSGVDQEAVGEQINSFPGNS